MVKVEIKDRNDIKEGIRDLMQQNNMGNGIIPINQESDLGRALKELNDDTINEKTKFSAIDMRTRLDPEEIAGILTIDTLVGFEVIPLSCIDFTQRKKRLNVSKMDKGRTEMVEVIAGKREAEEQKRSLFGKFFGAKPK